MSEIHIETDLARSKTSEMRRIIPSIVNVDKCDIACSKAATASAANFTRLTTRLEGYPWEGFGRFKFLGELSIELFYPSLIALERNRSVSQRMQTGDTHNIIAHHIWK